LIITNFGVVLDCHGSFLPGITDTTFVIKPIT
jgi:hypothetical protein